MKIILSILLFLLPASVFSQKDYVVIREITLEGNKKTKSHIIFRDLDFAIGDTILLADLPARFDANVKWFINTDLFSQMEFNIAKWDEHSGAVTIHIKVKEAWYYYPLPIFDLADRNFNTWWVDHNRSIKRINLGIAYYQYNVTGHHDNLTLIGQFGYSQKAQFEYKIPYFNRKKTLGIATKLSLIRNREISYDVLDYKLADYHHEEGYALRRLDASLGLTYRPKIRFSHHFQLGYQKNQIADTIAQLLNPDYFGRAYGSEAFFRLGYSINWDQRDINLYSMEGFQLQLNISQEGFFMPTSPRKLTLDASYAQYFKLSKRWSTEAILKGRVIPYFENPSFYHNGAIGGEDLRGYNYYVLNGQNLAIGKTSIRYQLWEHVFPVSKYVGNRDVPFKLYFAINNDLGVVQEHFFRDRNELANTLLWGSGIGLDFVFFRNRAFQVEYTRNHFGEKGLFLYLKVFN